MTETLTLKWGTLKGWKCLSKRTADILQRYADLGMEHGCAQQHDTPEQKDLLCEAIDSVDGAIFNDWTGEEMTAEEAKQYVREYRT